jgi:hypothetical protein
MLTPLVNSYVAQRVTRKFEHHAQEVCLWNWFPKIAVFRRKGIYGALGAV